MIEIPWLRSDVAANIRNNFAFYFGYERFGLYAACVAAVIVLNCMAVKFFFAGEYRFSAGDRRFFFNRKDKSELAGAAALAFSFLLYALNLFSLELSVFGNYDQMVVNNILDMRRGLQPVFTSMRFNPAAGIDHNIIYGITHHYALIGGWVLLKQALCLWLLYRFFVFVPAARRLFMLAAVNFLPAVFWVNGIVYSEQNTLIFVLLSLTALQKYTAGTVCGNCCGLPCGPTWRFIPRKPTFLFTSVYCFIWCWQKFGQEKSPFVPFSRLLKP